ncbi:phage tail protein [Stenotrophomonas rhizophila]
MTHDLSWRHARTERVGAIATSQFVGPGDDSIQLSGLIAPPLTGQYSSLATLREMADTGRPWALVTGDGLLLGAFAITTLKETQSLFFPDGTPRKVEFQLGLERVPDEAMAEAQP